MGKKRSLQIINPKYINRLLAKEASENGDTQFKMFSRIAKLPKDLIFELYNITADYTLGDCNKKAQIISEIMRPLGFTEIGCGTNRIAFRKNNYVYKIALDRRGRVDNMSEHKRSKEMPQIFYKVYEVTGGLLNVPKEVSDEYKINGEVLIGEYAELLSESGFIEHKNEIRKTLEFASNYYIMEDVGLTDKNYCNWGIRTNPDGSESLVIIDNAYFYPIRDARMITCPCGGRIVPSNDFTYYVCKNSACAMKFTVDELLNMSGFDYDREDEEAIKLYNADGSFRYLKVSGGNAGNVNEISDTEAEKLLASYKDATSFDASTVKIVENIEDYWNTQTDNDGNTEYTVPYKSLKLK